MTVSNVVNEKPKLVAVETLEHVQGVISRLGYRPNTSARSLRLSEARSVGVVIADTDPNEPDFDNGPVTRVRDGTVCRGAVGSPPRGRRFLAPSDGISRLSAVGRIVIG